MFIIIKDEAGMSREAAKLIAAAIKRKPRLVLGLATGSTPIRTYERLISLYKKGGLDFSQVLTFNLDEYVGLPEGHTQSYRHFMEKNLFGKINIRQENINFLKGDVADIEKECLRYEKAIEGSGGIDLQILGIGQNGHIAFNEPDSLENSRTRAVNLDRSTIEANARFFTRIEDVPHRALTMGIGTILEAKEIILLASGANKAQAVADSIFSAPSTETPASFLQKHSKVTFILDAGASKMIEMKKV